MTGWRRVSILFLILTGAFSMLCPLFYPKTAPCRTTPPRVFVCPFQSGAAEVSNSTAAALSDLLMIGLSDDKAVAVVDHTAIDAAVRETLLAGSGFGREADAMLLGRLVKADLAITGVLTFASDSSQITVRAIDPKSGRLLDTDVMPFNVDALEPCVSALKDLISNAIEQRHRKRKRRCIAFGRITSRNHDQRAQDAEALKSRLQRHYLAHPDKVRLDIVGLSPHIEVFELNPAGSLFEQLTAKLDDILAIHWGKIPPKRRELADHLYQNAMEMMQFSYRNEYFVGRHNYTSAQGGGVDLRTLQNAVALFKKTQEIDPNHDLARVALAHCYRCKAVYEDKRANDLFRKVYLRSDNHVLKRIAKKRILDGRISRQIFEDLISRPDDLISDLEKRKYIDAKGYVLNALGLIEDPHKFILSSPFEPIREQVFYLLQETIPAYNRPKLGSSSAEAIRHYERGQRLSHYRFKPKRIPRTSADRDADYLAWQYTFPPEVAADATAGSKHKGAPSSGGLHAAVNEFATALFLDPQFYEAMVMLSVCLRDPAIQQDRRADQLLEVVLAETRDEYLKYYAAQNLKKLRTTRFSWKLTSMLPKEFRVKPAPDQHPQQNAARIYATGRPRQAVTMAVAAPPAEINRTSAPPSPRKPPPADPEPIDPTGRSSEPLTGRNQTKGRPSPPEVQSETGSLAFEWAALPDEKSGPEAVQASRYVSADPYSHTESMGKSVALCPDFALIGSQWTRPKYPPYDARREGGAVFLLKRIKDKWQLQAELSPVLLPENYDYRQLGFGGSVAIDGAYAAVGNPYENFGVRSELRVGAVALYRRHRGQWQLYATLTTGPAAEAGGCLGASLDIVGDHVVVGEPEADVGQNRSAGAIHLYKLDQAGVHYLGRMTKNPPKPFDRLGEAGRKTARPKGSIL